jgi:hypothetical protein
MSINLKNSAVYKRSTRIHFAPTQKFIPSDARIKKLCKIKKPSEKKKNNSLVSERDKEAMIRECNEYIKRRMLFGRY